MYILGLGIKSASDPLPDIIVVVRGRISDILISKGIYTLDETNLVLVYLLLIRNKLI